MECIGVTPISYICRNSFFSSSCSHRVLDAPVLSPASLCTTQGCVLHVSKRFGFRSYTETTLPTRVLLRSVQYNRDNSPCSTIIAELSSSQGRGLADLRYAAGHDYYDINFILCFPLQVQRRGIIRNNGPLRLAPSRLLQKTILRY